MEVSRLENATWVGSLTRATRTPSVRPSVRVLAAHQKAISFLGIKPILNALIPEFHVSLRFGTESLGIVKNFRHIFLLLFTYQCPSSAVSFGSKAICARLIC